MLANTSTSYDDYSFFGENSSVQPKPKPQHNGPKIRTNAFAVKDFKLNKSLTVNKYSVSVLNQKDVDIREILLKKWPVHFVNMAMYEILDRILDMDYDNDQMLVKELTDKNRYLFDYVKTMYAVEKVGNDLIGEDLSKMVDDDLTNVRFEVRYSGRVCVDDYHDFLSAITWKHVMADPQMYFYQTEAYKKDTENVSKDVHLLRRGYEKYSFVGENAKLFIQIIPKIVLFYPEISLLTYICEYFSKDESELVAFLRSGIERERLEFMLCGLMVRSDHDNRTFVVEQLSDKRCGKIKILSSGNKISVCDYYSKKLHMTVHSDLQCVVDKTLGDEICYYPFSVLNIVGGQIKGPSVYDTSEKIDKFKRNCAMNLWTAQQEVNATAKSLISESNAAASRFGVSFSEEPVTLQAKILELPEVQYRPPDDKGFWDDDKLHIKCTSNNVDFPVSNFTAFSKTVDLSRVKCGIICYDTNYMVNKKRDVFCKKLFHYGRAFGWKFPEKIQMESAPSLSTHLNNWGHKLSKRLKEDNYQLVIFILPDGAMGPKIRSIIKLFEKHGNYVSVCVKPTDASLTESKIAPVIVNILHKVNARLGGVNYALAFPQIKTRIPVNVETIFPPDARRQYFGFNILQLDATFQSISCVSTVDNSFQLKGITRIEPVNTRTNILNIMEDEITRGLKAYLNENGEFPTDIVLFLQMTQFEFQSCYCDGAELKTEEITKENVIALNDWIGAFSAAFDRHKEKFPHKNLNTRWHIVTIVTDDGTFFFPPSQSENLIRSGLCVDEQIVVTDKPQFLLLTGVNEFFAVRQSPIRCTVFSSDSEAISLDDFEYITFYLCCVHPTKRRPIQFPLPLTAAMDLNRRTFENVDTLKRYPDSINDEPATKRSRPEVEEIDPFDEKVDEGRRADALSAKIHPSSQSYYCA